MPAIAPEPQRRISYHPPRQLSDTDREALWQLVKPALRTTREAFEQGLLQMDEVWVLRAGGRVAGFGGVRFFYPEWEGRAACVIFTGRVYLAPEIRGNSILQRIGLRYYLQQLRRHPLRRVYWMFGAGSYKSYLLLPRNFRHYWPHPEQALPVRERALLDDVARGLGNPHYDPATGIMRHPDLIYLDGSLAEAPARLDDPGIAFYARLNPGQVQGDDVMCLCPLTPSNWSACLQKMLLRTLRPAPRGRAGSVASGR